jgi:hypothetical protein
MLLIKKHHIKMKNIMFLLAVFILSACSEDFLRLYPKTSANESIFYQSQEDFILLVNGCYTPMKDYLKKDMWMMSELRSDNGFFQNSRVSEGGFKHQGVFDLFNETSDDNYLTRTWRWAYNGIYRCNTLLSNIESTDVTFSPASLKDRCTGEAYFMRALYYFDLVRNFGGVPIVLTVATAEEAVGIKRSTEAEVYQIIVDDLKEAASHFSNATDVEENGRASWGAAAGLLGKVYLYMKDYPNAETQLKSVIDDPKYSLLPNYGDLWNPLMKDYTETIFSIQYSEANAELSQMFIFWSAPNESGGEITGIPAYSIASSSYGWNYPTVDLINAFDSANDLRFDESIKFWYGPDWDLVEKDMPYQGKFKGPNTAVQNWCGDNFPILRYSDVLLMYAEVLNEQGRPGEAIPYIQQVRDRAGLTDPLPGSDQAALRTAIALERQLEFCWENQRWYDLKRTGKAVEVMTAHAARHKEEQPWLKSVADAMVIEEYKLLYPIPALEVIANGLEQNDGY